MKVCVDGKHVGDTPGTVLYGRTAIYHLATLDGLKRIVVPVGRIDHADGSTERVLCPDSMADARAIPNFIEP